ncbi:hypothetical protein HZS_2564 [Henneguya salminicola]|nr:hypothetical protein HZS_2564 [Henneguya salminicola]
MRSTMFALFIHFFLFQYLGSNSYQYANGMVVPLPKYIEYQNLTFTIDPILFNVIFQEKSDLIEEFISRFYVNAFPERPVRSSTQHPQLQSLFVSVESFTPKLHFGVDESCTIYI